MATVTITRLYNTGDNLTASYYNQDRQEIVAGVNDINNSQINAAAGILESKLLFNGTSGHNHSGGTNGRKILVEHLDVTGLTPLHFIRVNSSGTALEAADPNDQKRGFVWFLSKMLVVENDPSVNHIVPQSLTCRKAYAYVKVAPTGTGIIIRIKKTSGPIITTLTISAGQKSASTTSFTTSSLSEGEVLQMDITQVGSGVAGQGLTVLLDTDE